MNDQEHHAAAMDHHRTRVLIGSAVMAVTLSVYVLFAFFPFQWDPPRRVSNHADYVTGKGIRFPAAGIARTKDAPGWLSEAIQTNRLNLSLRFLPFTTYQHGPARIMTLSRNPKQSDFTIAQDGRDLVFRLRAPWANDNGLPPIRVLNVFHARRWTAIRISIRPGALRIAVNGSVRIREKLLGKPFRKWNPAYRLALGNELTFNRPWRGEIRRATVGVGKTSIDYALKGTLQVPPNFWYFHRTPILIPSWQMKPRGVVLNIGGFLPLGIFLGLWAHGRKHRYGTALVLTALFSAALESLQLCFAHRYPSVNDLILNTVGGGCGILLVHWLPYLLRLTRAFLRQA